MKSAIRMFGLLCLIGGVGLAAYFFLFFDVGVDGPGGIRLVNNGKMADRQNGIVFGFGLAVVGGILCIVGSMGSPAAAPQVSQAGGYSAPLTSGMDGYRIRPPRPAVPPRDLRDIEKDIDWDKA